MEHKINKLKTFVLVVFLIISSVNLVQATITTTDLDSGMTPGEMVNLLLGSGVTVSNITYTGANIAAGSFSDDSGIIGITGGIIMSSGNISHANGPNDIDNKSANNSQPGDVDLNSLITGVNTFDAAVLEFDFIPANDEISLRYVFASEEYNEYVNKGWNDVFGFFVNGINYAVLPDDITPVSINSVNGGNPIGTNATNPEYYRNNDPDTTLFYSNDTQADGLTVVLTLNAPVNKSKLNHIKLAIADGGDHTYDSWIFIESGSFSSGEVSVPALSNLGILILFILAMVVCVMRIKKSSRL